jgi:flagellar hook-associated protein 2
VAIYNGLVDKIKEYGSYDPASDTAGVLIGDSGLNLLLTQVRTILTRPAEGFDSAEDAYTMPAEVGIEIDRDGYLSVDTTVFDEKVAENYNAVLWLIGVAGRGASDSAAIQFDSAQGTEAGTYEIEVDYDADDNITDVRIRKEGETEWRTAGWTGNSITGTVGQAEQGLELTFISPGGGPGTATAEVRVQQGFGGAVYDKLEEILDEVDGPIAIKKDRYDDAITQLDKRIEAEEDRLVTREERLREKYARLEADLAQLDSFRAAFDSLFASLESIESLRRGNAG